MYTGHEAIGVWSGSDASVVRVIQLEWQQILESVFAEDGRALEQTAVKGPQLVSRLLVGAVNPIGVQNAGNQIQMCSRTWKGNQKNIDNQICRLVYSPCTV